MRKLGSGKTNRSREMDRVDIQGWLHISRLHSLKFVCFYCGCVVFVECTNVCMFVWYVCLYESTRNTTDTCPSWGK